MPEEYKERPPSVTALQFDGYAGSAAHLNNWLSNYGATVMHDSMRARAIIETPPSGYLTPGKMLVAEKLDWVVLHRGGLLDILKPEDFEFKYEPINGDMPVETPPEETVDEG